MTPNSPDLCTHWLCGRYNGNPREAIPSRGTAASPYKAPRAATSRIRSRDRMIASSVRIRGTVTQPRHRDLTASGHPRLHPRAGRRATMPGPYWQGCSGLDLRRYFASHHSPRPKSIVWRQVAPVAGPPPPQATYLYVLRTGEGPSAAQPPDPGACPAQATPPAQPWGARSCARTSSRLPLLPPAR